MTSIDLGTYVLIRAAIDDLNDAIKRRDENAIKDFIDRLYTVADKDVADRIIDELVLIVLSAIFTGPSGEEPIGGDGR